MLRTAKRCAGNFSRATMAPHLQQQQQQQQPSSQHASGSAASQQRSTSVLASLLRMRSQFMRLRGTQQQQVISVVLARSSKYRLLGSRDPLLTAAASGEEAEGEAAQNGGTRGDSSVGSSVLQEGVLLCTEAQRLLRSESRGNDPLSDVALSSPLYPVEAGRLLATAAMFGAATTYPRVQEVCAWLRFNADTLNTTRQVMSLCTPLLNLTDGATAGMAFVLEVLYEPLLSVLHDVGRDGGGGAASTSAVGAAAAPSSSALGGGSTGGSGGGGVTTEQQLVALTSCFAMVTKWSTAFVAQSSKAAAADATDTAAAAAGSADAVDAPHEGDRAKMLRITEATVAALMRLTKDCAEEDSRTHDAVHATLQHIAVGDAVQWLQCLHGLESAFATTMAAREERENALRRLVLCHRVLLPLVQQALERDCGAAAAAFSEDTATTNSTPSPSAAGTTAAGSSTSGPSSSSVLRVQDVANLVQIGLFPSAEASHTEVALRCGLRALAGTLAAASVRELCFMTQVVGKVRMHQPRALTAPLLRSLVAALRPRLFSLYGANAYQLRAQDCSLLLSQLSRWEDVAGVTISDDVVQLLCQRFSEQLSTAQAAQLVPFLQGLARLEERRRRMDVAPSAAAGKAVEVREGESADSADTDATTESARLRIRRRRKKRAVRYHYSTTARVAQQCAQRAAVLASGSGQAKEEASAASATPADRKSGGAEAPRLTAVEAAQLISSLVQLSSPLVDDVFAAVEPLLAADLALAPTAAAAAAAAAAAGIESASALSPFPAPAVDLSARVAVQEALIRFLAFANTRRAGRSSPPHVQREFPIALDGAEGTVKRASVLLVEMEHSLTTVVQHATRPRDVVAVWPLVRHRLLTQRAVKAEEEMEEDVVSPPSPSSSLPSHASSAKRSRAEVRLAMCFAQRVCAVAPECNDAAMGSLAVAITSLTTSGTLPIAAAHQAVEALLMRCVAGLEAASVEGEVAGIAVEGDGAASATPVRSASPLTLNLDTCKKVMDAARSTMAAVPPAQRRTAGPPLIFLRHIASLCTSLAEAMTAQDGSTTDDAGDVPRGTQHAYTAAKKDVRRHTMLGRTIVSFCAGFLSPSAPNAAEGDSGDVSAVGQLQYEAWCSAVAAYLDVVRAAMRRYATEASLSESWCGAAADGSVATPLVPLDLLSMTARVVTQLQRLLHRSDGAAAAQRIEVDVEVGEEPSSAEGGAEEFSSATNTTVRVEGNESREDVTAGGTLTTVDVAVAEVLSLVGDTIALLAKQERQATVDDEPAGSGEDDAAAGDAADADKDDASLSSSHSVGTSAQAAVNPKDILMLLQSFEMAKYRHTEMLYGILPELRSCAAELNPLQLSLLIHALAQLGAWNSRLLRVLAAAVEAKVRACELRQCHNLLRDLCRSGSVSPNTFVELRGTAYADWTRGGPRRQQQQKGVTTQEPLQRLAEAVLCRLDALIRTKDAFLYVAVTAAVGDLVGVVAALRFFEVPPPPTFDAFVVLAIHKLAALHKKLPASTAVQHALVLLDAASRLRQPAHQRVSVRTLWVIVQRVVASASSGTGAAAGSAVDRVLPWRVCGQLWQLACQHTLRYGKTTTAALFEASQPDKATLLSLLQGRLGGAVEAYAWGPNPQQDAPPSSLAPPRSLPSAAAVGPAKALPVLSFPAEQIALRRCGARATPSLVRADRELDNCLCYPLRLARRIVETQDVSGLVASSPLTAPLRQARQCVRLAACLLRADVWESESIAVETQLLLVAALQRLWDAADVHGLLCAAPESFSTEELVVLTALAGHLLQAGTAADIAEGDARRYREACASALRQLSAKATQWRLAAAVDAWMLHVRLAAPPASPQLRLSELEAVEGMHATLARSGEVVLAAFLQLQPSSSSSSSVARTRLNAELMRFFQTSGSSCLSSFAAGSSSAIPTFSTESDHSSTQSDEMHFREQYAEVQRCIVTALAASSAH